MDDLTSPIQYSLLFRPDLEDEADLKHTFGHIDCPACEAMRDSSMYDPDKLRRLTFSAAVEKWLASRKAYLKPRTYTGYELHAGQLKVFFGALTLQKIHLGNIREFQQQRLHNVGGLWPERATASYVNHQIVILQGVLQRAGEWEKIKPHYEALRVPSSRPPKLMSDIEEIRFFDIGSRNPSWEIAFWAASITINSGASGTELRNLRFADLHLEGSKPWIRIDDATAKNEYRGRVVPLNGTAYKNVVCAEKRAKELGSWHPDHFLFPFRKGPGKWDITRATTDAWLRRTFDDWKDAAGIPWLTPHCLRHQHITLSMEAGEPIEQIALRVGHEAIRMTRHYMGGRNDTQFRAVQSIDPTVRFGPKREGLHVVNGAQKKIG